MVNLDLVSSAKLVELTFELFTFINPHFYGEIQSFNVNHSVQSQLCSKIGFRFQRLNLSFFRDTVYCHKRILETVIDILKFFSYMRNPETKCGLCTPNSPKNEELSLWAHSTWCKSLRSLFMPKLSSAATH